MPLLRTPRWGDLLPWLIAGALPAVSASAQGLPDALPAEVPVLSGPLPPAMPGPIAPPSLVPRPITNIPPTVLGSPRIPAMADPVGAPSARAETRRAEAGVLPLAEDPGQATRLPFGVPAPTPGAALYDHGRTMVANGEAASLTLHHDDFVPGGSDLTPRGEEQLARHLGRMSGSLHPLLIEPTPDRPDLAPSRRLAVLNRASAWSVAIPPERVLVGRPAARGLSGIDAQIIGINAMDRTSKFGPPIPILSHGLNSPAGVTGP